MKPVHTSYAPDDAGITLEALEFLHGPEGQGLRQAVAELLEREPEPSVAAVAALRKAHPPEGGGAAYVRAALTLGRLQARGAGSAVRPAKFPELPYVWATPEALEQATGTAVGRWKAQRFAALRPQRIVDLCAGIGGDTLSLAEVAPTLAVDLSPVRLACLRFNAEQLARPADTLAGDVRAVLPGLPREALFHIDPARRSAGRRSPRYEDLIPGPAVLEETMRHFAGGALKLSPAVDFDSLPPGHLELISSRRTVVQAVLWVGSMAALFPPGTRTASVEHAKQGQPPAVWSYTASPTQPTLIQDLPMANPEEFRLYEMDGALTRAQLAAPFAHEHGLAPLTVDGGYLLGPKGAAVIDHAALQAFALCALVPYSPERVADALYRLPPPSRCGAGRMPVEVKARGHLPGVDTDVLQRTWAQAGAGRTVLLFAWRHDVLAAIGQRDTSRENA